MSELDNPLYAPPIYLIGVSHHTLGVDQREQLSRIGGLEEIYDVTGVDNLVVTSTCNRLEFVTTGRESQEALVAYLASKVDEDQRAEAIYIRENRAAVEHLFRVVGSLDSMVVGETQITGQVKQAYRESQELGRLNKYLHRLFQLSFQVSKRIRSTGLGSQGVSISYVAVRLAEQIFEDLSRHTALLIGSGEMAELALLHLKSKGCHKVIIANRTISKAAELAERFIGRAVSLAEIPRLLNEVDLIIGSISIDSPILTQNDCRNRRRSEPLFLIDLGLPRNFSPLIKELSNTFLYDLDNLNQFVSENLSFRREAALESELFIEYGIYRFEEWLAGLRRIPFAEQVKEKIGAICQDVCESALKDLVLNIPPEVRQLLARRISNQINHFLLYSDDLSLLKEKREENRNEREFDSPLAFYVDEPVITK